MRRGDKNLPVEFISAYGMLFTQFFRERTFKAKGSEKRREMINGGDYSP